MEELKITWMYPDILNLHGDRGNIMALERIGKMLDLKVNIEKIENYAQKIDYDSSDIIFFNPGELKASDTIIEVLKLQKEQLDKYIEAGKMIILIGTSGSIMAKEIIRKDGTKINGLGYLDMICQERELIYGDDIHFVLKEDLNIEIMGCQIQVVDTYLNSEISLGVVEYGRGNAGKDVRSEGAKYKNVIFTNALGPVLVKNPWYTEMLIKTAMKNKGIYIKKVINKEEYDYEYHSLDCIKKFIENKEKIN